jgi:4-amino-4-deoxy-L-arabinose transferase-like glycosyltransferase
VLRVRNLSSIPLWLDEAQWALILAKTSWLAPSIRPLGFMGLSTLSVRVFGATEFALRILPCLAGVATSLVAVPLARELFRGRAAQLLFVASIALHPLAIDYAKEFKPYAFSLLLHLLCIFFALRYARGGKLGALLAACGVALIGPLFAQDLVFAFPGVFLVLGLSALRDGRRSHLVLTVLGGSLCIATLFALYWFSWRALEQGGEQTSNFWGGKYDVFYLRGNGTSRLGWVLEKCRDIAALPGSRRERFHAVGPLDESAAAALAKIDAWVWVLLQVLGLALLAYRGQRERLLLLALPLVVWFSFNQFGFWPFGAFRTNLFALAYVASIAAFALEAPTRAPERNWSVVAAGLLVFAPLLTFERDWHAHKAWPVVSSFGTLADTLFRLQGSDYAQNGDPLVLDAYSCSVWSYYLQLHPAYRLLASDVERRFRPRCARFGQSAAVLSMQRARRSHGRVWLVLMNPHDIQSAHELSEQQPGLNLHELDDHSALVGSFSARPNRN